MPRLPPSLIRQASSQSPFLPLLLRECRDLTSARNELRWLSEHASGNIDHEQHQSNQFSPHQLRRLRNYVNRRSRGEPLQYILGTQPFGDLEILCRRHVLIPRPETEVYTVKVAQYIIELHKAGVIRQASPANSLRIADLCSGSGCISLLLHSLLVPHRSHSDDAGKYHSSETDREYGTIAHNVQIRGFDISPHALRLSNDNLLHGIATKALHETARTAISFRHLDVLTMDSGSVESEGGDQNASDFLEHSWDVIVSNPPYISPLDFAPGSTTTRSVREYEPRLALVPPTGNPMDIRDKSSAARKLADSEQADQFYHAILHLAHRVRTGLVVMEIGDSDQATRVRDLARKIFENEHVILETWLDDGSEVSYGSSDGSASEEVRDNDLPNERAVVLWRGKYALWRDSSISNRRP